MASCCVKKTLYCHEVTVCIQVYNYSSSSIDVLYYSLFNRFLQLAATKYFDFSSFFRSTAVSPSLRKRSLASPANCGRE